MIIFNLKLVRHSKGIILLWLLSLLGILSNAYSGSKVFALFNYPILTSLYDQAGITITELLKKELLYNAWISGGVAFLIFEFIIFTLKRHKDDFAKYGVMIVFFTSWIGYLMTFDYQITFPGGGLSYEKLIHLILRIALSGSYSFLCTFGPFKFVEKINLLELTDHYKQYQKVFEKNESDQLERWAEEKQKEISGSEDQIFLP